MLLLQKQPEKIALAGNPIVFTINSSTYLLSNGSVASMKLYLGAVKPNEYIEIMVHGIAVRLTGTINQDDSGTQFAVIDYQQPKTEWLRQTVAFLKQNYVLSTYFDISAQIETNSYILFTAREKGFLFLQQVQNTLTGSTLTIVDGTNASTRDFYAVILQTWLNNVKISEYNLPVDADGNAYFDVSTMINSYIESSFEFPETSKALKHANMSKLFKVKYAEMYGIERTINMLEESASYFAIGGKIADYKQQDFYNSNSGFLTYLNYGKSFLNWHPGNKNIQFQQIEKLYFLFYQGYTNRTVKLVINAYENELLIHTVEQSIVVSQGEIWEFQLNPSMRLLPQNTEQFYVWLEDATNGLIVSEIKRYNIDTTDYPNQRLFLFKNSLNCYETILFTGIRSHTSKYTRQFSELFPTFNPNERKKKQVAIQQTEAFKATSSWLTFKELAWTNELLSSDDVYEILNDRLMKVSITSNSVEKDIDNNFNYSIQIEYEYDGDGYVYPCDIKQSNGDFNSDYNNDFVI